MCDSWRHLLLENDVIHGVRRCNTVFTLERRWNTCKRMRRGLSIGGSSLVQEHKESNFSLILVTYIHR